MSTDARVLSSKDVEERVLAVLEISNSLEPGRITDSYAGGYGFGYRTRAARPPHQSLDGYRRSLEAWLGALARYQMVIDELHTAVDGDVGLAWGLYHEEFQTLDGPAEVVRGRFSEVMKREPTGWRTLFYHRDATPFDARGVYSPPSDAR